MDGLNPQPLKLAQSRHAEQPRRDMFKPLTWMRWLQDDGPFAELTRVQLAVLMVMARAANDDGDSWWARGTIADRVGCQAQAVSRARQQLEAMGLVRLIAKGGVRGARRASRYRVIMQTPRRAQPAHEPDAGTTTTAVSAPEQPQQATQVVGNIETRGVRQNPPGGAPERLGGCAKPPDGGAPAPPNSPTNSPANSKGRAPGTSTADHDPSLFESPEATRAAAAAELIAYGIEPHAARGAVNQHRPTAEHVRTAIANLEAWLADSRAGRRNPPKSPVAVLFAMLGNPDLSLDASAKSQQKRAKQSAKRSQHKAQAQQLDAAWEALGDAERERLRVVVLADMEQTDPRRASYYAKARAQDEPIRSMIAHAAINSSAG